MRIKRVAIATATLGILIGACSVVMGQAIDPKPTRTGKAPVKTVYITKERVVTATSGSLSVAAEPGANLLVEPLNSPGAVAQTAVVPADQRIFLFNGLKPGRYRVAGTLAGHVPTEKEIMISANKSTSLTLYFELLLYRVTLNTNIRNGDLKYGEEGRPLNRVASIQNGKVQLQLPMGTYALEVKPDHSGYEVFRRTVSLTKDETFDFELKRSANANPLAGTPASITTPGRFYALVIGNNNYQYALSLKTAETDAQVVASVLRERFGFENKLLLNATRQDIFSAISYYRRTLDQNDSLLIYYAGHGYFDRDAEKASWLPVDARQDDHANWISADDITSSLKTLPAKHVLVISDSCFSGTISRGLELAGAEPTARDRFLQKMISGKSRTLMPSGGNEPVADGGGSGHSIFARAFLAGLGQMEKDQFTAEELFRGFVQESVAGRANQTPEYNPLRNSGHDSGDFVFIRRR